MLAQDTYFLQNYSTYDQNRQNICIVQNVMFNMILLFVSCVEGCSVFFYTIYQLNYSYPYIIEPRSWSLGAFFKWKNTFVLDIPLYLINLPSRWTISCFVTFSKKGDWRKEAKKLPSNLGFFYYYFKCTYVHI